MPRDVPQGRVSPWPAGDARLRTLWDDGLTTAEIGRRTGVSKDAVIGRAHRLGLTSRKHEPVAIDEAFIAECRLCGMGLRRIAGMLSASRDRVTVIVRRLEGEHLVTKPFPAGARTLPLLPSEMRNAG